MSSSSKLAESHFPLLQTKQPQHTCYLLLVVVFCIAIKGVMSFLTRWVLIGVSRDIEFDIRNDLLDRLLLHGAGILRSQPDRAN